MPDLARVACAELRLAPAASFDASERLGARFDRVIREVRVLGEMALSARTETLNPIDKPLRLGKVARGGARRDKVNRLQLRLEFEQLAGRGGHARLAWHPSGHPSHASRPWMHSVYAPGSHSGQHTVSGTC
jgi:hypothetical protein